ncbi:hypothetical protein [Flavivirga jejuensis]|uniref:Knr4/Smi1-like domain-containing protein n=1 Tax=Flavivirga jejuensis TaxID=870487 RepID=A0ABT8WNX1_9FLAO|nr:hypothetical protein [Flavivirga jejuensis]MDO5974857.1 hypothetical protein [Flavivirga jejuensis]
MVDFSTALRKIWKKKKVFKPSIIKDSVLSCGGTIDNASIEKRLKETNLTLPDVLKRLLEQYGKQALEWMIPNPSHQNRLLHSYGSIWGTWHFEYGGFQNIIGFKDNVRIGIPFFSKVDDVDKRKFLEQLYILKDLKFGKLVLIKIGDDDDTHELYLFDHPQTLVKLTINLEQYLSLTEKTMGLYCWEEYVTEDSYKLDGSIPDSFHQNMAILFPDEDLSAFRNAPELEDSVFNRFVTKQDKVDYRAGFIAKMKELQSNPNIEFKYYENSLGHRRDQTPYTAHYGVKEVVLRKIKRDYGREIPESMLAFYYQMNGCRVQWEYNAPEDEEWLEGKINFLELEEVMGGKWKESYLEWNSPDLFKDEDTVYYFNEEEADDNPKMAELMLSARIFDEQGEMQDYFINFIKDQEEPDIYKIVRTNFYKMNIDFITFVEARIEFLGIKDWEYKYINDPDFDEAFTERILEEFRKKVIKVLPSANFDKFI